MSIALKQILPPLISLVFLILLYPTVRKFDRQHNIEGSVLNMREELAIENKTDLGANQISLIQERINELLSGTQATASLSRTGMITYTVEEDDDTYSAHFSVTSLNYVVDKNAVVASCKTLKCISLTRESDEQTIEANKVSLVVESAEQGDRLIEYLQQFEQLCQTDTNIDTGIKRRLKKWVEKVL